MENEEKNHPTDPREKLLDEILSLDADDPYRQSIIHLQKQFNDGQLNEIQEYLLINGVLAAYDMDVLYENEKLEMKRQRELIEMAEKNKEESENPPPCVPIQNADDITEVAIKTKMEIGQIFLDGYSECFRTIGVKNLGLRNQKGKIVTELSQIKSGKRYKQAIKTISQYGDFDKRPDLKRYAIQATDIYIEPMLSVFDGRGKHSSGYYRKRLTPFLIESLLLADACKILTNTAEIAREIKLVDPKYRIITQDELEAENNKFSVKMVNLFYSNANREIEKIIFSVLDNLQDNLSAISYYKNFAITKRSEYRTEQGTWFYEDKVFTSTKDEDSIIRKTQAEVLREFNANGLFTIYLRNQANKFYKRVIELINERYGFVSDEYRVSWRSYHKQIEIRIENYNKLQDIYNENYANNEEIQTYLYEARQHLINQLYKKTESDYKHANERLNEDEETIRKRLLNNKRLFANKNTKEIMELFELDIYTVDDLKKMLGIYKKPYRYWESSLDIQYKLINFFVGEKDFTYQEKPEDTKEIKEINDIFG